MGGATREGNWKQDGATPTQANNAQNAMAGQGYRDEFDEII